MTLEEISKATIGAIEKRRFMTYVPRTLGLVAWVTNAVPWIVEPLFRRLMLARIRSYYASRDRLRLGTRPPEAGHGGAHWSDCILCGWRAGGGTSRNRLITGSASCGLLYQHPLPDADVMREFAEAEYSDGVYRDYVAARELKCGTFRERLALIHGACGDDCSSRGPRVRVSVDVALQAGYDATGVEFSGQAIALASREARPRLGPGERRPEVWRARPRAWGSST